MGAVYTQLSLKERRKTEDWWHAKVPVRDMARVLKRHKSTIHRRNRDDVPGYGVAGGVPRMRAEQVSRAALQAG